MKNKVNRKNLIIIIGLGFLVSHALVLYAIFLEAYFNNFIGVLEINMFGEAHIEFVFMPLTLLVGFYSVYKIIKMLKQNDINVCE